MSGKSGSIVRDADDDRAAVGKGLIDTVRDGNADRVGAEIVIMNRPSIEIPNERRCLKFPTSSRYSPTRLLNVSE
jgi:hypothetical protein